jgi:hypothetical protein
MGLSNLERQQRWQARQLVKLTAPAKEVADKLIGMADQDKLRAVAKLVNAHLGIVAASLDELEAMRAVRAKVLEFLEAKGLPAAKARARLRAAAKQPPSGVLLLTDQRDRETDAANESDIVFCSLCGGREQEVMVTAGDDPDAPDYAVCDWCVYFAVTMIRKWKAGQREATKAAKRRE